MAIPSVSELQYGRCCVCKTLATCTATDLTFRFFSGIAGTTSVEIPCRMNSTVSTHLTTTLRFRSNTISTDRSSSCNADQIYRHHEANVCSCCHRCDRRVISVENANKSRSLARLKKIGFLVLDGVSTMFL